MQGYLRQALMHLGREELRAGEDAASAALPLAEPQPSSIIPLPLSLTPAHPLLPQTHHTRSACSSGCPHASLGALAVTPHHAACTVVAPLRAYAGRARWLNGKTAHACAKVRAHLGAGMPNAVRESHAFCASVCTCTFLGQCVLIRAD